MAASDDDAPGPVVLGEMQKDVAAWADRRWPDRTRHFNRAHPFYRILECMGTVAGALFDSEMDREIDSQLVDGELLKAALGEMVVHQMDLASRYGWSLDELVGLAWREMSGPNFTRWVGVGRPRKEESE